MKILKIVLWIPIAVLAYLVFDSIMAPIRFSEEKNHRYSDAIGNLIDIRNSQLAYKSVKNEFAKNWGDLVTFIENDKFTLISRRDTSYMVYDNTYRMDRLKEEVILDTLGFVSVKDSLFPNTDRYKTMMKVPNIEGKEFELKTAVLNKNGIKVPVFVARISKKELLEKMDKQLVIEAIDAFDVKGNFLQVGDLEQANVSGNWAKYLEPGFKEGKAKNTDPEL